MTSVSSSSLYILKRMNWINSLEFVSRYRDLTQHLEIEKYRKQNLPGFLFFKTLSHILIASTESTTFVGLTKVSLLRASTIRKAIKMTLIRWTKQSIHFVIIIILPQAHQDLKLGGRKSSCENSLLWVESPWTSRKHSKITTCDVINTTHD